jgi:hypothetical protein
MTPFPSEPVDRHARFIAAFCEDLASADYRRGGRTPRADAIACDGAAVANANPGNLTLPTR